MKGPPFSVFKFVLVIFICADSMQCVQSQEISGNGTLGGNAMTPIISTRRTPVKYVILASRIVRPNTIYKVKDVS